MGRINRLDPALVNQIAAGEVVVQPCSVLKECIENSFDAGASEIAIEFDGGGADGIKLSDNGMGMEADDLLLSIEPHATSKINSVQDLYSVTSCGFRGEALASIAEVSDLEITSRTRENNQGNRLFRSGGAFKVEPAARAVGTTLSIKNLFHNVPVRRRFLKSDRAEAANNLDVIRRAALSRPWVAFVVRHDGKLCFDLPADQTLAERVSDLDIFGHEARLVDIEFADAEVRVSGLIAAPPVHFGNGQKIMLHVNKRPFRDKALTQAAVQAFDSYIPERRYPGVLLNIEIQPEEVDVNIHPSKSEVRFHDPATIFKKVYAAIKNALADRAQAEQAMPTQTLVYKTSGLAKTIPMNRHYGQSTGPSFSRPFSTERPMAPEPERQFAGVGEPSAPAYGLANSSPLPLAQRDRPRAFQVLNRFIILEHKDSIEIMDQHAIHERILFNQLSHEERGKPTTIQSLLNPVRVRHPHNLEAFFPELLQELKLMGYHAERCAAGELEVQGVPDFLGVDKAVSVLESMLADLGEGVLPDKTSLRRDILHSASCRAAIKAGDPLSAAELDDIVAAVASMDLNQGCCPHGRNAKWKITIDQANAMFNR